MDRTILEKNGKVATITLNRLDKLNAIDNAMLSSIEENLEDVRKDRDIIVVVFRGAGKSFSVGQDLSGEEAANKLVAPNPRTKPYASTVYEIFRALDNRLENIRSFPRYTVSRVHGYCLGIACQLAMSTHFLITADNAIFGDPSIRLGLAPFTPLWTWRVGIRKTKELLLTGKYITGCEAMKMGLAMKAASEDQLDVELSRVVDGLVKYGHMGGYDGQTGFLMADEVKYDLAGFAAARKFCVQLHSLSALKRPGRSITDREDFDFYSIRAERGLKTALRMRDEPFAKYMRVK